MVLLPAPPELLLEVGAEVLPDLLGTVDCEVLLLLESGVPWLWLSSDLLVLLTGAVTAEDRLVFLGDPFGEYRSVSLDRETDKGTSTKADIHADQQRTNQTDRHIDG